MTEFNTHIKNHYHQSNLFENILDRLKEQGINLNHVSRNHIAGVDEFHVRGSEVSKELVNEVNLNNLNVLDVGCGLGGPSRMLADKFNCNVIGIDMNPEFIRTANNLSELVNLNHKTKFIQGNALELPFENNKFDVVWTQHVQMNIENKQQFYAEINRVLEKNGVLIYYDIFKVKKNDIYYPVPWANDASISFLQTIKNMDRILKNLGFKQKRKTNQSIKAKDFLVNLFEKINTHGPPKLGLNMLMGSLTKEKLKNILNGLIEKKIVLESGIYQK